MLGDDRHYLTPLEHIHLPTGDFGIGPFLAVVGAKLEIRLFARLSQLFSSTDIAHQGISTHAQESSGLGGVCEGHKLLYLGLVAGLDIGASVQERHDSETCSYDYPFKVGHLGAQKLQTQAAKA